MRFVVRPDGKLEDHPDDHYATTLAASPELEHAGWRFATAEEVDAMVEEKCAELRADADHHKTKLQEGE